MTVIAKLVDQDGNRLSFYDREYDFSIFNATKIKMPMIEVEKNRISYRELTIMEINHEYNSGIHRATIVLRREEPQIIEQYGPSIFYPIPPKEYISI